MVGAANRNNGAAVYWKRGAGFMRKLTLTLGLLAGIISVVSTTTAQQVQRNNARDQVCVFEHSNFSGWQQCFLPGEDIGDLGNYRNKISSIRVFGSARMTIFANKNFEGASMEVTADMRDLAQYKVPTSVLSVTWNDVIESVRVAPTYTSRNYPNNTPPPVYNPPVYNPPVYRDERDDIYRDDRRSRNNSVCIYEDIDFRGRYACFDSGDEISDFGRSSGWNDRISSIRVNGVARITLYRDINFRGDRVTVDRDIADLRRIRMTSSLSWDNQVSSLDINGGRGRAYGRR